MSEFVRPCVLDLKVGVRTYRDDASPEKRRRAIEKAGQTTTASLGFRLCGMQVFDQGSSQFLCRNKYYGRRLTDLTVKVCAAFMSECILLLLPVFFAAPCRYLQISWPLLGVLFLHLLLRDAFATSHPNQPISCHSNEPVRSLLILPLPPTLFDPPSHAPFNVIAHTPCEG